MKIVAVASVRKEAEFTQPHEEKFALHSTQPYLDGLDSWIFKALQLATLAVFARVGREEHEGDHECEIDGRGGVHRVHGLPRL